MESTGMSIIEITQPDSIIVYGGLALLLLVVFAESGLFFGFFLPGDSLLFIAGILCESHLAISLWVLILLLIISSFVGVVVGYGTGWIARKFSNSAVGKVIFKKKYLDMTKVFYRKYGVMAFILGRFLPIIRTFVPILAGMVNIRFSKFLIFNFIGVCLWVGSLVSLGYWLGRTFPQIINYIEIIVIGLILITALPVILTWVKSRQLLIKKK